MSAPSLVSSDWVPQVKASPLDAGQQNPTALEVIERAQDALSLAKGVGVIPIARPFSYLFRATFFYLVATDPLDRIEGLY